MYTISNLGTGVYRIRDLVLFGFVGLGSVVNPTIEYVAWLIRRG